MRSILCFLFVLAACGRPLTPSETAYLRAVQGDDVDVARVRMHDGHFAGSVTYNIPVRPRTTCQQRIWPAQTESKTVSVSPGATVFYNRILFRKDLYREDFMAGFPEKIDLLDAMLFAHEMTHVWQWQNRKRTGYTPLKALREHTSTADPYLFEESTDARFLDYGYEQQGSIVEEYICCRLLDPAAPRTARLQALIAQEMPVTRLNAVLGEGWVRLPWAGAETEGICR